MWRGWPPKRKRPCSNGLTAAANWSALPVPVWRLVTYPATPKTRLLPVRLRAGGRSVGGAMSWGDPKTLAPFPEDSPFVGLPLPDDVDVTSQVVAQPDPTLTERVIASLSDGTPLVTRKAHGAGQIVLFHVTANAEWSTLPLSGLFVQMLERLSISSRTSRPEAEQLAGTTCNLFRCSTVLAA